MNMLRVLLLVLFSGKAISGTLPFEINELETELSFFNIAIENFDKKEKKDLLRVPRYILEKYLYNKSFPTEADLNIIGSKYDLPNGLLYAMFWKESQYKCNTESDKGAEGCFQFRTVTAKKMGLLTKDYDYRSNPWISADAAARYLAWNFEFLNLQNPSNPENWKYAVAAYNAGPNKIKQDKGLKIPLYTETQYYVEDIIGYILGDKYIVQYGDLIENISKDHNLHLATFRLLNGKVTNNRLQKGSFVTIKAPKKFYRYIVQPGDSMTRISQLTGVSIQTIGQTNNIKLLSNIESGQVLYLPLF